MATSVATSCGLEVCYFSLEKLLHSGEATSLWGSYSNWKLQMMLLLG